MDLFQKIFRESPSLSRVNPAGLILMLIGVVLAALAGKLSHKVPRLGTNGIKVIGLLICAGGALLAILG